MAKPFAVIVPFFNKAFKSLLDAASSRIFSEEIEPFSSINSPNDSLKLS